MDILIFVLFAIFMFSRAVGETRKKQVRRREEIPSGEAGRPWAGWPPVFPGGGGGPFGPGRDFPPVALPPLPEAEPPAKPADEGEPLEVEGAPGLEGAYDPQQPLSPEGAGSQEGTTGEEGEDILHPEHRTYRPPALPLPVQPQAVASLALLASGRDLVRGVVLAEVLGPPRARRKISKFR